MTPPRLATWFLRRVLHESDETILGDLGEDFHDVAEQYGVTYARRRYRRQVFRAIPLFGARNLLGVFAMLKNHLAVSLRNLARHKGFSAINVAGLAMSLAVALLIITFLRDQARYDHFHTEADRIYRVNTAPTTAASGRVMATSPLPLGPLLNSEYPEVQNQVRLTRLIEATSFQDQRFGVQGFYADSSFFQVFSFPLAAGNPARALNEPHSILLSIETAEKFFGTDDPVGQTLTIADVGEFTVTGVFADLPHRSHLEFEAVASLSTLPETRTAGATPHDWERLETYTYLLLDESASASTLESKLRTLLPRYTDDLFAEQHAFELQAVTDINLGPLLARSVGRVTPRAFGYVMAALAVLIVLAACINYMNLSIARSWRRAREIGVRKALGAHRRQVAMQFLTEAVVIALIALVAAVVLFNYMLLPQWNTLELVHTDFGLLTFGGWTDKPLLIGFVGLGVLVGLAAGIAPALRLSTLRPTAALKGMVSHSYRPRAGFRRLLVVFQFTLSLLFLITTLLVYRQSAFMLNADFGFRQDHILNIELRDVPHEVLRSELIRHPAILEVSASSGLPAVTFSTRATLHAETTTDSTRAVLYTVDPHFIDNLALRVVAGRNVRADFPSDRGAAVLLNETAVRALNLRALEDVIGQSFSLSEAPEPVHVVGVLQDFQFDFLWNPITPLVLHYDPARFRYANVRFRPDAREAALQHLEATWATLNTAHALEYRLYDEQIMENYRDFGDFIWIFGLMATLAVVIACSGLLAIAHYHAEQRVKEVGIRKALGASVGQIVMLLSRRFLMLVAVAAGVGVPLTWFLNRLWLDAFANRVPMDVSLFASGIAILLMLACIAVGSQTFRAARANPVHALRYE